MEEEAIRDLNRDFAKEATNIPRSDILDSTAKPASINQGVNTVTSSGNPRSISIPESAWQAIQQLLTQAGSSPIEGVPPLTPAAVSNALSHFGLTIVPMGQSNLGVAGPVSPNNSGTINMEKIRPETVEEARLGKKKVIPSRDFESARDDTDSFQDVQEIQKALEKDEAISKEAYIQQQLREVEQTLRQQIFPEQGEKKKGQGGPEKRTITRAVTINDRVENPKKGRTEHSREKAQANSRVNFMPAPWAPHRLRRSPFSEDILADLLPTNYKPINLEYDGKEDPSIHMARFESMVSLHQYSEGIKCRIFSTTLVGVAQQWFQKLEESSIYNFEELYNLFMH